MALEKELCETLSELEAMLVGAGSSEAALPESDAALVGLVADYVEGIVTEDVVLAGLQAAFARNNTSSAGGDVTTTTTDNNTLLAAADEDEWNAEMYRLGRQRAAATLLSILRQPS